MEIRKIDAKNNLVECNGCGISVNEYYLLKINLLGVTSIRFFSGCIDKN